MERCRGLLLLFLLSVVGAGCSGEGTLGPSDTAVRIGAVYPFSGPQAADGEEIRQGIDLALEIINGHYAELDLPLAASAGLPGQGGLPLRVIYADHQGSEAGTQTATEGLIRDQRVAALMGAYQSAATAAASARAEAAGIPFLNAESTSPGLTERGFEWFFRTTPTDTHFVIEAFEFITDLNTEHNAGLHRVAVIREPSDFGSGFKAVVDEWAPQYGLTVVGDVVSGGTLQSVAAEVAQIRNAQPDAVLFAVYSDDAIRFMREFRNQDYAPPLIWANNAGFITQEFQQALGADADYVTSREVWSLDLTQTSPLAAQVNDLYRARYGMDLNGNAARAFIGLMTLAEALNRAGSTDPKAVREALRATDIPAEHLITQWDGIQFDATGQNTLGRGIIVQMLDGRYTTVWPAEIAVESVVFPFPSWTGR